MEVALFIQNIQEERAEVALHIFGSQSNDTSMNDAMKQKGLTERFQMTDRALEDVPTWPNVRSGKIIEVCISFANVLLTCVQIGKCIFFTFYPQ